MMQFVGTIVVGNVYDVQPRAKKEGDPTPPKKKMISFTVADELGTKYPCQMWEDDPQFAPLAQVIASARRCPVQMEIASYSLRIRKMPDGKDQPQINFIVTRVAIPNLGLQAA
jgi:hypothetical protein